MKIKWHGDSFPLRVNYEEDGPHKCRSVGQAYCNIDGRGRVQVWVDERYPGRAEVVTLYDDVLPGLTPKALERLRKAILPSELKRAHKVAVAAGVKARKDDEEEVSRG